MKSFNEYRALSFDCYGTLIDWEAGLADVLCPWAKDVGLELDDEQLLLSYAEKEAAVMRERPTSPYPEILAHALRGVGEEFGKGVSSEWATAIANSVPDWPAFPDSAEALAALAAHYDLVILSNVHRAGFAGSNAQLKGEYSAVITAEDVNAYKPAAPHFDALDVFLTEQGLAREDLLHVAQSLFHDHVPARRFGLDSVWINRRHDRPGWGATPEPSEAWTYGAEYTSMAEFVAAVKGDFSTEEQ